GGATQELGAAEPRDEDDRQVPRAGGRGRRELAGHGAEQRNGRDEDDEPCEQRCSTQTGATPDDTRCAMRAAERRRSSLNVGHPCGRLSCALRIVSTRSSARFRDESDVQLVACTRARARASSWSSESPHSSHGQIWAELPLAVTMRLPSGLKAASLTAPPGRIVSSVRPLAASQTRAVPSSLAVTTSLPSGLKDALST